MSSSSPDGARRRPGDGARSLA